MIGPDRLKWVGNGGGATFSGYTYWDFLNDYNPPNNLSVYQFGCLVTSVNFEGDSPIATTCGDGRSFLSRNVIVTVPGHTKRRANPFPAGPPSPHDH